MTGGTRGWHGAPSETIVPPRAMFIVASTLHAKSRAFPKRELEGTQRGLWRRPNDAAVATVTGEWHAPGEPGHVLCTTAVRYECGAKGTVLTGRVALD